MRLVSKVCRDCRGAAVAEVGLIAAMVGVAIAVAALALGSAAASSDLAPTTCAQAERC